MDAVIEEDFDEPSERDLVLLKRGKQGGKLRVIKAHIFTSKELEEEEESERIANEEASRKSPPNTRLSYLAANLAKQASFEQYVQDGCEVDFCVAVDFTSSNGDPRTAESLHYIYDSESHNDYQEVIQDVGSALLQYSSSEGCKIWGFGAKFEGQVQHIFQCGSTPTVKGIEGIQEAYRSIFATGIVMSGPPVYDSVIQAAAVRSKVYHVSIPCVGDNMVHCYIMICIVC
jgi:hypothetical protein